MPWQCRLIEKSPEETGIKPQIGDMWFAHRMLEGDSEGVIRRLLLSAEYDRDWLGKRPPIVVCLPNGEWFNVDAHYSDSRRPNPERRGWTVTGEAPNITVSPSINCIGRYHGWLQNGVLSDDIGGRTYGHP